MKIFSIDSPLMQFLSKAADLILLSLLFVVFSLPIITVGPSTTALYSVLIKRSGGYEGSVIPAFWRAYKENFKTALWIELIFLPLVLLSVTLVCLIPAGAIQASLPLVVLCLLPGAFVLLALSYVFPLAAQFENTPANTVKNAFVLSVGNFPVSILVTVLNLLPVLLAVVDIGYLLKTLALWTLIGFALIAWVNEKLLHRVFRRYLPPKK